MNHTTQSLLQSGFQARQENRLSDARADYAEAVQLSRLEGNLSLLIKALKGLGGSERDLGHPDTALAHYSEAASLLRNLPPESADPLNLAHTVRHLADILRESGQLASAGPNYREALDIYQAHPDTPPLDLANTLRGSALLASGLGQTLEAIRAWQAAGALYTRVHVQPGVDESRRQIALLSSSQ